MNRCMWCHISVTISLLNWKSRASTWGWCMKSTSDALGAPVVSFRGDRYLPVEVYSRRPDLYSRGHQLASITYDAFTLDSGCWYLFRCCVLAGVGCWPVGSDARPWSLWRRRAFLLTLDVFFFLFFNQGNLCNKESKGRKRCCGLQLCVPSLDDACTIQGLS